MSREGKSFSLSDQVHDQILELIIRSPEDEERIFNEKALAEQFGVSKAPVREALIKLCGEGVLRNVPRLGYLVITMTHEDVENVAGIRCLLELEALKTTEKKLNDAMLKELNEQIERAASRQNVDAWEVWDDNEEFHMLLAAFSGNKIIRRFLGECMSIQKRAFIQNRWDLHNTMVDSIDSSAHRNIYNCLVERDFETARTLLRNDIEWKA